MLKRIVAIIMLLSLIGCNKKEEVIDLRGISGNILEMKYNEIINNYDRYADKEIIVSGKYISWIENGKELHLCRIESKEKNIEGLNTFLDIEFELKNNEYPEDNDSITIKGKINRYEEYGYDNYKIMVTEIKKE